MRWSNSSIMRITSNDGTELFVKEQGTGRPVLMIHGWPLQADTFDDLGLAVAEAGMRAIAYDRRGFGRSDQPASGYDYNTLVDDLTADLHAELQDDGSSPGLASVGPPHDLARVSWMDNLHATRGGIERAKTRCVGLTDEITMI